MQQSASVAHRPIKEEKAMNILAIVGSPRKGGNTDTLVDHVIQGAKSQRQRMSVKKIYVNDLRLEPCRGDVSCRKTGKCVISDDMTRVLEMIEQADGLILGSPLYRGYLSGQMKVLMDRTNPLEKEIDASQMKMPGKRALGLLMSIVPQKLQAKMMQKMAGGMGHFYRLKRKDSVVVVVGAHPGYMPVMKKHLEQAAEALGSLSLMSGGNVVSSVLVPGVAEKGDVQAKPKFLEAAAEAGRRLASAL
jgi:NAD(P)H-dependent FMN reductase